MRSGGGLWYGDADEFREALELLAGRSALRDRLAAAARGYVEREYRWPVVLERYRGLIDAAARDRAGA